MFESEKTQRLFEEYKREWIVTAIMTYRRLKSPPTINRFIWEYQIELFKAKAAELAQSREWDRTVIASHSTTNDVI